MILKHDATHGVQFVDFDRDGRLDLALTNNDPDGGGHPLLRNTATMRGRAIAIEVTDPNARRIAGGQRGARVSSRARGSCCRRRWSIQAAATARRARCRCTWASRDDWKGKIDIEVITLAGGLRHTSIVRDVDPDDYRGRSLRIITTH